MKTSSSVTAKVRSSFPVRLLISFWSSLVSDKICHEMSTQVWGGMLQLIHRYFKLKPTDCSNVTEMNRLPLKRHVKYFWCTKNINIDCVYLSWQKVQLQALSCTCTLVKSRLETWLCVYIAEKSVFSRRNSHVETRFLQFPSCCWEISSLLNPTFVISSFCFLMLLTISRILWVYADRDTSWGRFSNSVT